MLALFAAAFLARLGAASLGIDAVAFGLAAPVARPWTLVTSVYAHGGVGHLLANAVALAVVGIPLERVTTRFRFHAFVLATGALAGLSEVAVGALLGGSVAVIGASGAVLALYGYALTGNALAGGLLSRLDLGPRGAIVGLVAVALLVTLITAGPGVALVAHFTGFALGVVAGRRRVLHADA